MTLQHLWDIVPNLGVLGVSNSCTCCSDWVSWIVSEQHASVTPSYLGWTWLPCGGVGSQTKDGSTVSVLEQKMSPHYGSMHTAVSCSLNHRTSLFIIIHLLKWIQPKRSSNTAERTVFFKMIVFTSSQSADVSIQICWCFKGTFLVYCPFPRFLSRSDSENSDFGILASRSDLTIAESTGLYKHFPSDVSICACTLNASQGRFSLCYALYQQRRISVSFGKPGLFCSQIFL